MSAWGEVSKCHETPIFYEPQDETDIFSGVATCETCGAQPCEIVEKEDHFYFCDKRMPKGIYFENSRISGIYLARCQNCAYICANWECAHDLTHDCKEN